MIKIVKDVTLILGERKNIDMMKKSTRRQLEMKQVRKNLCEYSFIKNMQVVKMTKHQSETSEPEDSEKSNWSERPVR